MCILYHSDCTEISVIAQYYQEISDITQKHLVVGDSRAPQETHTEWCRAVIFCLKLYLQVLR